MTRDYVNYKRKRQRKTSRGPLLFLAIFTVVSIGSLFMYAHYKSQLSVASLKENLTLKLGSYFPQVFHKEKTRTPAKKVAAAETETIKPIHFDFYDELPKEGMALAKNQPVDETDYAEPEEASTPAPKKSLAVAKAANEGEDLESTIEKELATDLSSIQAVDNASYIIQVSVFPTLEAAKRYKAALAQAGLKVDLVVVRLGKKVAYRLQQGPYRDMDQVKLAKKRLTERGIACDVHKMTPYIS